MRRDRAKFLFFLTKPFLFFAGVTRILHLTADQIVPIISHYPYGYAHPAR